MSTRLPIMTLMTILLALALAGVVAPTPAAADQGTNDLNEATRILERIDQSGKPLDANTRRLVQQAAAEMQRATRSRGSGLSESAEFRQQARRALSLARQAEAAHGRGGSGGSGFTPSVPGFGGGGTTRKEAIVRGLQGIQGMLGAYAAGAERKRAAAAARQRAAAAERKQEVARMQEMMGSQRRRAAETQAKKQAEQEQGKKTLMLAMLDEDKQAGSFIKEVQEEIKADRAAIDAAVKEAGDAADAAVTIASEHPQHADPTIQALIDRAKTLAGEARARALEASEEQTQDGAQAKAVAAKAALRDVRSLDEQITQATAQAQETKALQTADMGKTLEDEKKQAIAAYQETSRLAGQVSGYLAEAEALLNKSPKNSFGERDISLVKFVNEIRNYHNALIENEAVGARLGAVDEVNRKVDEAKQAGKAGNRDVVKTARDKVGKLTKGLIESRKDAEWNEEQARFALERAKDWLETLKKHPSIHFKGEETGMNMGVGN